MRALRSIGALVAVLVVPAAANAYTLRTTDSGHPVRWDDTDVSFRVDRALARAGAESDVGRTVAEAFTRWGAVPGSPFLFRGVVERLHLTELRAALL